VGFEAGSRSQPLGSSSNLGVKGTIELNKLAISINYDAHSGSVFRGRSKGREHRGLL